MQQAPLRSNPQPTQAAPQQKSGGMFSGLGGVMAQGMAFGAGSEIAHTAIRSVMGGGGHSQQQVVSDQQQPVNQQQQQQNMCQYENSSFVNCLKDNGDALSMCQSYFDMLKQCEKKYA